MKKQDFVNPESRAAAILLLLTALSACQQGSRQAVPPDVTDLSIVSTGNWSVFYDPEGLAHGTYDLSLTDSGFIPLDSIHFQDSELADSLVFSRGWAAGGGMTLVFSVTVPAFTDQSIEGIVTDILEDASLSRPQGLRRIYLSDRNYEEIENERASSSVEPPPEVSHRIVVVFDPTNPDTCLFLRDSLTVDFTGSSADSMQFFIETGEGRRDFVLYPDESGVCSREYTTVLRMNMLYTGLYGEVLGHARLTSAYLTGAGFFPLSATTQNYTAEFILPDSIFAWTPLVREPEGIWHSEPGGITGGLPVALGNYTTVRDRHGYTLSLLSGGLPDSVDRSVVETLSEVLNRTLDFASADFAFTEVQNPDGSMVLPVFGGIFFSRGSLEPLSDVSNWVEMVSTGEVPEGFGILFKAGRGILMQSLRLDPVLEDMLVSWLPVRYYSMAADDSLGLVTLRQAYMKYYLYNTETAAIASESGTTTEYALADPLLAGSPLGSVISSGKGVILLEYMDSRGILANLPALLQGFTHSWSSNYWPRVYSTLLYSDKLRGQYQELLQKLFYLPGVPQIRVSWLESNGTVYMDPTEIQPGVPFSLPLDSIPCLIHLQDTSFTRTTFIENGILQTTVDPPPGFDGTVTAIDLNHEWLIPADFMYRRENP